MLDTQPLTVRSLFIGTASDRNYQMGRRPTPPDKKDQVGRIGREECPPMHLSQPKSGRVVSVPLVGEIGK